MTALGQAAADRADAGRPHPAGGRARPSWSTSPFPVATDQLRQLRLDNIGPLDVIPTTFGFEPRPMEGALGYLRTRQRDQAPPTG